MVRGHMVAWVSVAVGAAALAITAGLVAFSGETPPAAHPQASAPPSRTVVVSFGKEKTLAPALRARVCGPRTGCANGQASLSLVRFVGGDRPPKTGTATVLTDTNCDPDAYGISHCLNALRLPGGGSLVVRHAHDMHAYPCLTPGDRVKLLTVEGFAAA